MGVVAVGFEVFVVEAIGESGEGQAWCLCRRSLLGFVHAASGDDGGGEGDFAAEACKSFGKLKGRVYKTLRRETYEKKVVVSHRQKHSFEKQLLFFFFFLQRFIDIK